MGQSRPTVRTTDQSKARRLGGGTDFFSTHGLTARAARVACLGLAALKVTSLVPRLLFTERENSLVNCVYHFGSNILKSL